MQSLPIDVRLQSSIKWLYAQTEMFNGEEISQINKGVIQGGTLSPTLFTVFINDLIAKLE